MEKNFEKHIDILMSVCEYLNCFAIHLKQT